MQFNQTTVGFQVIEKDIQGITQTDLFLFCRKEECLRKREARLASPPSVLFLLRDPS